VRRGLVDSRQEAQAAVAAGTVLVSGTRAEKPARLVAPDEPVVLLGPPSPYVGRGGLKLRAALDRFPITVTGRRALDAGASTGGFTDCLLQGGAAHVYAVDVGHGQLHPALRQNPLVTVLERTNVRTLTVDELAAADLAYVPCPLVVADLSFISLRSVVPALTGPVSTSDADLVLGLQLTSPSGSTRSIDVNKINGAAEPVPQFRLVVYDRKTHYILWTLTRSIEIAFLQKTHDHNFDDALTMLLLEFESLTGKTPPGSR